MKVRAPTKFELVENRSDGGTTLRGMASVVYDGSPGSEYELFPGAVERIAPGAFKRAIEEKQDVVALLNHSGQPLGRTTSGTLRLRQTDEGLEYEADLPDTTLGKDVRELLARGDLSGSSFAFRPTKKAWSRENGRDVLTIRDLDLVDVSVVTTPAYKGTSASVRSEKAMDALKAEAEAMRATRERREWLRSLAG